MGVTAVHFIVGTLQPLCAVVEGTKICGVEEVAIKWAVLAWMLLNLQRVVGAILMQANEEHFFSGSVILYMWLDQVKLSKILIYISVIITKYKSVKDCSVRITSRQDSPCFCSHFVSFRFQSS